MNATARHRKHQARRFARPSIGLRPAFTLVEMLVAVALVLLMMMMFAQVFQLATETMIAQKGRAENDQRARMLVTILKNDLRNRTFEMMVPLHPGENFANMSDRRGYFYASENTPGNHTDDVLQFTISVGEDDDPLYGRTTLLPFGAPDPSELNQPEADDGQINSSNNALADNTGRSRQAEVSYFLRNGNLYRRVLLLRQPYIETSDPQPPLSVIPGPLDDDNFWTWFDYSATFGTSRIHFHPAGDSSLTNEPATGFFKLGKPMFRFGHFDGPDGDDWHGRPREYVSGTFIGRFTHEETSHPDFGFPGRVTFPAPAPGHPFDPGTTLTLSSGVISEYSGHADSRRGEDLLLSHVHAFDVKLWDEALGQFMDVGHSTSGGDFFQSETSTANRNMHRAAGLVYGPRGSGSAAENRVFDTWHPEISLDGSGPPFDPPPFRPLRHYPSSTPVWAAMAGYSDGDHVFPQSGNAPYADAALLIYRATPLVPPPATSGASEPSWPDTPGDTVIDGDIEWTAVYNPKRVRAIQIRVQYYDVSSDQMRQLTIVQSLLD